MSCVGMIGTYFVADSASGYAVAINIAGSLRMQSYRVANALRAERAPGELAALVAEFEARLLAPELRAVTLGRQDQVEQAYERVSDLWRLRLRAGALGTGPEFLAWVDGFVAEIDGLVNLLEESSEEQIGLLRAMQLAGMLATLLVIFIAIHDLRSRLSEPLDRLLRAAEAIRGGDFAPRVQDPAEDELGMLATAFNEMAEQLSRLYGDLEARVEEQTRELHQRNQSLGLLFETTRQFNRLQGRPDQLLGDTLTRLKGLCELQQAQVCLYTGATAGQGRARQGSEAAVEAQEDGVSLRLGDDLDFAPRQAHFDMATAGIRYGHIAVGLAGEGSLSEWQVQLIEAIADMVATHPNLAQQTDQAARLVLMEERATIARELHDSLAQSLSYQKIQVARTRRLHEKGADQALIFRALDELQQGLNTAYRQLRELLSTFRLRLDVANLRSALTEMIADFSQRGEVSIRLDYGLGDMRLSPNEEVHVLQIIREALANVVQHSRARTAWLYLASGPGGRLVIRVTDDGIGLSPQPQRAGHFGLVILKDRADRLRGDLEIGTNDLGGTTVRLEFTPAAALA
jgi:two-component system nitrate/nitrite sensor histidine kinase NarX